MEKKMANTIVYWGYIGDNGRENGNYYNISSRSKIWGPGLGN